MGLKRSQLRGLTNQAEVSARAARAPEPLKPLTALRFPAALMVFMDHTPLTSTWSRAHMIGTAGVGFFFVLSGFILTWRYASALTGGLKLSVIQDFYVARVARIYPLVVVATVLTALILLVGGGKGHLWNNGDDWIHGNWVSRSVDFTAALLMVSAWIPTSIGFNLPAWSITDEAFFYLLFPIIAFALLRIHRNFGLRMALLLIGVSWVSMAVAAMVLARDLGWWQLAAFPPSRLLDFCTGMVVAMFVIRGAYLRWPTAVEITCILGAAVILAAEQMAPQVLRYSLALLPLWAILILAFALQSGRLSKLLSLPTFVRLGEVSFALFLIHFPVLEVVSMWLTPPFADIVGFGISIAVAFALFHWIETPARKWIRGQAQVATHRKNAANGVAPMSPSSAG